MSLPFEARRKESGVTLLETLILLAILGILTAFAALSMTWFPQAEQKERARQAAYFLYALIEEARKLERSFGRDVFLAWDSDKNGSITKVSLYLDDNLDGVFNPKKDTLHETFDFSTMFQGAFILPGQGVTSEKHLSIQTGPRPTFASGAGTFWVVTKNDAHTMGSSSEAKRYASYGVVVNNVSNMGARVCQAGLDCP